MPSMIDVLKGVDPQEVAGHILANPKIQMAVGATATAGGGVLAKASMEPLVIYLGVATAAAGFILTLLCIVHRAILINKDLKYSKQNE